jgi:polysaccharide biosynthesis protein PslG
MRRLLPALILVALCAFAPSASAAVPKGWLGVSFGPEYIARKAKPNLGAELARMRRSGVGSARFALYWFHMQPYPNMASVPPGQRSAYRDIGGIPTDLRFLDQLVGNAAQKRLPLMPVVLGAPRWATDDTNRAVYVPRDPADYARFMDTLVRRYGPTGTFWTEHPDVHYFPIRTWQVWNEVSNSHYWDKSWARTYPPVLSAAYDAIKAVDPQARVVQSGLNSGESGSSWHALDVLYDQLDRQGLGRPFDEVATHVYTRRVPDALKVVEETRDVMRRHDDSRPIRVTELAWPAAKGRLRDADGNKREFFAATTDKGMAKRLTAGVMSLANNRKRLKISGVDWFQWASAYKGTDDAFRYSGLRNARGKRLKDKPAMKAFTRVAKRLRR